LDHLKNVSAFSTILSRAGDEKIIIRRPHIIEDVRDLCNDMGVMAMATDYPWRTGGLGSRENRW